MNHVIKFSEIILSGFTCQDENQTIPFENKCDGHRDCSDGSDEFECGMLNF